MTKTVLGLAAALLIGGFGPAAFAQASGNAPSSQLPPDAPPTVGSNQGVQPPNSKPGAYPAGTHPKETITTNPASDPHALLGKQQ